MVAEALAVFMFCFMGGMSCYEGATSLVAVALAHGLTIAIMIVSIGSVSGGHINPVVTLAVWLCGGISLPKAVAYWVAQIVGGVVGGFFIRACTNITTYIGFNGGALPIVLTGATGIYPVQAVVLEMVMTSFLVFTVLMCAVEKSEVTAAFAIGLSVGVDVLAGGRFTGASMNIARSFGPLFAYWVCAQHEFASNSLAVQGTTGKPPTELWNQHWIHWVGPILGSLIAVVLYRGIYSTKKRPIHIK